MASRGRQPHNTWTIGRSRVEWDEKNKRRRVRRVRREEKRITRSDLHNYSYLVRSKISSTDLYIYTLHLVWSCRCFVLVIRSILDNPSSNLSLFHLFFSLSALLSICTYSSIYPPLSLYSAHYRNCGDLDRLDRPLISGPRSPHQTGLETRNLSILFSHYSYS